MSEQENTSTEVQQPAAEQPDVGRGLKTPVVYEPDENGVLVEASPVQAAEEPPIDKVASDVIVVLQEAMSAAGLEDNHSWLSTLENGIFSPGIQEQHCIFLINRCLRLLILERRDIPEADRNVALAGIVDVVGVQFWLPAIEKVVLPIFKQYGVGVPGMRFTPGQEPAWYTASNPKVQSNSLSGAPTATVSEEARDVEKSPLEHGNTEWNPEQVATASIETSTGTVVAKPIDDAAPSSSEPN